jgi:NitT/TauT family transport system ATP-binding protein
MSDRGLVGDGPIIAIEQLRKTFRVPRTDQEVVAVDGFSLVLAHGEFVSLVGPSGCGKSTVLNIVAGLDKPTGGRVLMQGNPIAGPSADRGMVFQDYALFPWLTIRDNVGFGLRHGPLARSISRAERAATVQRHLDLVGLAGFENRYPHELSGGMRQRCALARLLANRPKVLLMDEPFAALDAQTRSILQEELLRIWGQEQPAAARKTVAFVTHSIDEAVFLSDRVAVMSRHPGRLKEVIAIDLPRPRTDAMRRSAEYQHYADRICTLIREEAFRASLEG